MITTLYAVYDKVAEEFGPMFDARNDGIAMRNFKHLLASQPVDTPDDYRLYRLGHYDNSTGICTPLEPIKEVLSG